MTFQAICIRDSGTSLNIGQEYTIEPLKSDPSTVIVPGLGAYHASRFERVQNPQAPTPAPAPGKAPVPPAEGLAGTLAARGSRYGSFETNGSIAQEIKRTMRSAPKWGELTGAQAEALDMFASKISRMLTGDPDYSDNWHDIAGYATLVEDTLTKN